MCVTVNEWGSLEHRELKAFYYHCYYYYYYRKYKLIYYKNLSIICEKKIIANRELFRGIQLSTDSRLR